jgi:N-acetylglutamate synthase-like GNAT family acetyltransferase
MKIREMQDSDRDKALEIVRRRGDDFVVSRGRISYPHKGKAFILEDDKGGMAGIASYEIDNNECEITLIEVFDRNKGHGTGLLEAVKHAAKAAGCRRLWLITTNNNVEARMFYQNRGMALKAVHKDAMKASRQKKPSIPLRDEKGVEIRDELEFEIIL